MNDGMDTACCRIFDSNVPYVARLTTVKGGFAIITLSNVLGVEPVELGECVVTLMLPHGVASVHLRCGMIEMQGLVDAYWKAHSEYMKVGQKLEEA